MFSKIIAVVALLSFVGCDGGHAGENFWKHGGPSYSCTRGWYYEDGSKEKFYDTVLSRWVTSDDYRREALALRRDLVCNPQSKRPPFGNKGKEKTDRPWDD
jgi:hypothetical protein